MTQEILNLLGSLMSGEEMTPGDLDSFIGKYKVEKQYFEYKHGAELDDTRKGARTLRQYVSGFANSDGGILFVGVDNNGQITGCPDVGRDLSQWASDCLTPMATYFSPAPRFLVVEHEKGKVLVLVTARSLGLVPCNEGGRPVYYFRFDDKTLQAPEYLVSDLILGRRQGAYLHLNNLQLIVVTKVAYADTYDLSFRPFYEVENESIAWAEDVRVGIISLAKGSAGPASDPTSHLLRHIDVKIPSVKEFGTSKPLHSTGSIGAIEPFKVGRVDDNVTYVVPLRVLQYWYVPYSLNMAVYVIYKGSPPIWHQLCFHLTSELLDSMERTRDGSTGTISSGSKFLSLTRLSGERPIVSRADP